MWTCSEHPVEHSWDVPVFAVVLVGHILDVLWWIVADLLLNFRIFVELIKIHKPAMTGAGMCLDEFAEFAA